MRELRFYGMLFLRRIHWLVLLTLLGTAAGLLVARTITPIYEADALMVVEGDKIPDNLSGSQVQTDTNAKLQVIRTRVLARDSLLDIAQRMNLYPNLRMASGARDADAVYEAFRNSATIEITGQKKDRKAPEQATFLSISYQSGKPALAAQVANELVTRVLKEDRDIRTKAARDTLDFFTREVDRLSAGLAKSSAAILKFKQENGAALPERLGILRDQVDALTLGLQKTQKEGVALESQRDRLVRRHELSGAPVNLDKIYPPRLRQISELSAQRAALKSVLPEDDPRLAALGAQIETLKSQGSTDLPEARDAFEDTLRALEDDLYRNRADIQATQEKIAGLRDDISHIPANAAALEALNRDHDNLRDQYDRAVKARAVAMTGDTIESLSKGEKLTVIEQAVAPSAPAKPNRKTLTIAGFGLGLMIGLVLVAALSFLNPGIRRPEDLSTRLGITAFATLPFIETAADKARKRRRLVLSSSAVAVTMIGVMVLIGLLYKPLDLVF